MLNKLYEYSPIIIKKAFLNSYSLKVHKERYGQEFKSTLDNLSKTQYYSKEQIEDYQNRKFLQIVDHAFKTVPYYINLSKKGVVDPAGIKTKGDITKLPLLKKETIRSQCEDLMSRSFRKKDLVHGHTSGTTGTPLDVYWDKNTCIYNNALDWRQKLWAGVAYGDKLALLLGRPIVGTKRKNPPFWINDFLHKQLWMSAFHLNEEFLPYYIDKLKKYEPVAIEGYPSTVFLLAKYCVDNDISLSMKAIFTSSETLYPHQKEIINKAFNCRVYDFFGMAERVLFATECGQACGKHLNFEYGITEILDEKGEPVADGEYGYLTGTTLQNFGMPLLRYQTSDISRVKNNKCKCGRHMDLIDNVTTKSEDIIKRPDGTMISPSVLTHPFKPLKNIVKSQIVQYGPKNIKIKVVKKDTFNTEDLNMLLSEFKKRVLGMDVDVEFVEDIPREKSGKYRWVICKHENGL